MDDLSRQRTVGATIWAYVSEGERKNAHSARNRQYLYIGMRDAHTAYLYDESRDVIVERGNFTKTIEAFNADNTVLDLRLAPLTLDVNGETATVYPSPKLNGTPELLRRRVVKQFGIKNIIRAEAWIIESCLSATIHYRDNQNRQRWTFAAGIIMYATDHWPRLMQLAVADARAEPGRVFRRRGRADVVPRGERALPGVAQRQVPAPGAALLRGDGRAAAAARAAAAGEAAAHRRAAAAEAALDARTAAWEEATAAATAAEARLARREMVFGRCAEERAGHAYARVEKLEEALASATRRLTVSALEARNAKAQAEEATRRAEAFGRRALVAESDAAAAKQAAAAAAEELEGSPNGSDAVRDLKAYFESEVVGRAILGGENKNNESENARLVGVTRELCAAKLTERSLLASLAANRRRADAAAAHAAELRAALEACLLYTSPSPRDKRQSRMPSSA